MTREGHKTKGKERLRQLNRNIGNLLAVPFPLSIYLSNLESTDEFLRAALVQLLEELRSAGDDGIQYLHRTPSHLGYTMGNDSSSQQASQTTSEPPPKTTCKL